MARLRDDIVRHRPTPGAVRAFSGFGFTGAGKLDGIEPSAVLLEGKLSGFSINWLQAANDVAK